MKVGIYTPYLDSFGGGERYVLTVAEVLSSEHQVDLLLDKHHLTLEPQNLVSELGKRLNLDLSKVNLKEAPLGEGTSILSRAFFLKNYDLFFYLTDGSIFYATSKKNLIHFQVPFKNTTAKTLWGRMKLSSWNLAVCNSKFTQSVIEKEWPIQTCVIYPPVEVEVIKPLPKRKQILSVGRFASFSRTKKHEEMIETFRGICKSGKIEEWSLHLAGSVEGDESYIDELRDLAKDIPVTFYPNYPYDDLVRLYGESSIYWHAAGFGEDDPAKMEHFGIATVEAMAGGCVPVVINKGGQPEIVEDQKSGLLWSNLDELQEMTLKLIDDPKMMSSISKEAVLRSKYFSKEHFAQEIKKLASL